MTAGRALSVTAEELILGGRVYRVHRESGTIQVMTLDDYMDADNASDDGMWIPCLTLVTAEARSAAIRGRS